MVGSIIIFGTLLCALLCGIMVIIVGNGHDDTSSNPGQD